MSYRPLVDRNLREYCAEYARGLSSHLPMCVYSLHQLGAPEQELEDFYQDYVKRLVAREPASHDGQLSELMGQHTHNEELFQIFNGQLEEKGLETFLTENLERFMPSVATAAFHPLIRLGFALEMNHQGEIAESFASWGMGYAPVESAYLAKLPRAPYRDCVPQAAAIAIERSEIAARNIFLRAGNVMAHDAFKTAMRLPDDITVRDLAELTLAIFIANPSFANMHLMTSCHALRIVESHVPLAPHWLSHYWLALWAVYVSEGSKGLVEPDNDDPRILSWEELAHLARNATDDHTSKFVFACKEQQRVYGERGYQLAASLQASGS